MCFKKNINKNNFYENKLIKTFLFIKNNCISIKIMKNVLIF